MQLKIGDKVRFLNEQGEGEITGVLSSKTVLVRIKEGMEIPFQSNQLVLMQQDSGLKIMNPVPDPADNWKNVIINAEDIANAMKQKKSGESKPFKKPSVLIDPEIEVDLHIHELTENAQGMSNGQMLELQLRHVRHELESAIAGNAKKITFIHGVGTGRLKQEIYKILGKYEKIRFQDASYGKYGFGATEVILR